MPPLALGCMGISLSCESTVLVYSHKINSESGYFEHSSFSVSQRGLYVIEGGGGLKGGLRIVQLPSYTFYTVPTVEVFLRSTENTKYLYPYYYRTADSP